MKTPLYFEVVAYDAVKNAVEFNRSTNIISDLYSKTLNLPLKGINKVSLELSEKKDFTFSSPTKMFPFVLINKNFDFNSYWAANEVERKLIVFGTLYESVVDMCEKMKLDITPFENAYQKVKSTIATN